VDVTTRVRWQFTDERPTRLARFTAQRRWRGGPLLSVPRRWSDQLGVGRPPMARHADQTPHVLKQRLFRLPSLPVPLSVLIHQLVDSVALVGKRRRPLLFPLNDSRRILLELGRYSAHPHVPIPLRWQIMIGAWKGVVQWVPAMS
jgi:hypothetical protein